MAGVLMIAVQALEKRAAFLQQEKESLKKTLEASKAESAELKARLDALERLILTKDKLARK
jgi:outer membrane murein-binding lipoprotein Lpp